jgi:hypothetical protein
MNEPKICSPGNHQFREQWMSVRSSGSVRIEQCNNCVAVQVIQCWLKMPEEFVKKPGKDHKEALYHEVETIAVPQIRFLR